MSAVTTGRRTVEGGRACPHARLDAPQGAVVGHALFAHCLTGDDGRAAGEIARTLAWQGIGVLRVESTGLGGSGGDTTGTSFSDTSFAGDVEDLVRAADRMREAGRAPSLLVGHCLGGAAVLAAAARIPEVRAVATIGAPLPPSDRADGAPAPLRGRLAELTVPLLLLHAPDDAVVDAGQARRIADAVGPTASVVALQGADHPLSRPADARWAATMIAGWAARFLTAAEPESRPGAGHGRGRPEPGTVVVSAGDARPYGQDVATDLLHWSADEPVSAGGAGSGPDPYQLLLSSLGACTAITLRMYADRAGLPLDDATVTLTHDRLHARDCAECETSTGHVDRIVREIHLEGDLDDAQRAKLLAIADRCPVHRTLTSEIVIETDEV
ncbi:OsmC family protein [Pseudonocardia sp. KRD-291]|nr:OsmC family protein [Pseudonocardia sp. KRD291]